MAKKVKEQTETSEPKAEETPSNLAYTVNADEGVITETTREAVVKAFDGKRSAETVNKMLDDQKVLPSGKTFFSLDRSKLVKFEKPTGANNAPVADEKLADDTTPAPEAETPSEAQETQEAAIFADEEQSSVMVEREVFDEPVTITAEDSEPPYEIEGLLEGFEIGDRVVSESIKTDDGGIVINKDGKAKVQFELNGKLKSVYLTDNWTKAENVPEPPKENALVKQSPAPVVKPLTKAQKSQLKKYEENVRSAKSSFDNAPKVIAANLSKIREENLWRESVDAEGNLYTEFGEYIVGEFGITREYGFNMAQIGDMNNVLAGLLEAGAPDWSVKTANAYIRGMNKLTKELGLGKVEFNEVKPIINAGLAILQDLAEKDENGEPMLETLTPRLVKAAEEKLLDFVKTNTVEIEGEQITIEQAKAEGLLNTAYRDAVMTEASEGILRKREIIKSEVQKSYEKNHEPPKKQPVSDAQETYIGATPRFGGGCATHGKPVIAIYNGNFECGCTCRYRMGTDGNLECYETNGQKVK